MITLRNKLIALAAAGVLVSAGIVTNSRPAVAQQGPPDGLAVRIVNPLPVPVTGSTTISGTVAATQSGPWSVAITSAQPLKTTAADDTVLIVDQNVNQATVGPFDVKGFKQIRVIATSSAPFLVYTEVVDTGNPGPLGYAIIDSNIGSGGLPQSKVFDAVAQKMQLQVSGVAHVQVYGRND